jgi:hypothetical protein
MPQARIIGAILIAAVQFREFCFVGEREDTL